MKSREVYSDCCYARDEFSLAIKSGDYKKAKVMWFSCLTLLRAIGHVLHKVDSKQYGKPFSDKLQDRFKSWKKDEEIYKDFIEKERNQILKEYSSSILVKQSTQQEVITTTDGEPITTSDGDLITAEITLQSLVKAHGHLAGETPLTVLNQAIDWWDKQLEFFESVVNT